MMSGNGRNFLWQSMLLPALLWALLLPGVLAAFQISAPGATVVLPVLLALALILLPLRMWPRVIRVNGFLILLTALLLLLSGCGTAPSWVQTTPPVPAGLLTPPRPPVLLLPISPLAPPGTTRPSTPGSAPRTGSTTNA